VKLPFEYYAFFDVDDTLINIKSMFSFMTYFAEHAPIDYAFKQGKSMRLHHEFISLANSSGNRKIVNKAYYRQFAGVPVEIFDRLAASWAILQENRMDELLIKSTVQALKQHKQEGGGIVFVSGSFPQALAPFMQALEADHCLASQLVINNGILTGEIGQPQTIGEGKAIAIREFLHAQSVASTQCFAYGDDISDVPMLKEVGTAAIIQGNKLLEIEADVHQWQRLPINA